MARNDVRLVLRLPLELHEKLVGLADQEERSLNGEIVYLLRNLIVSGEADPHSREFREAVRVIRAALAPLRQGLVDGDVNDAVDLVVQEEMRLAGG